MTRIGKAIGVSLLVIVVLLCAAIRFTIGWRPFIGPRARPLTNRTLERTPARLERGRYVVEAMTGCLGCHSEHDWTAHDAPILPGMKGAGEIFPVEGTPGRVVAPNITPDVETGVGAWTDDELARAIREGISRDGHTLFPIMPYRHFRSMSDEDLASVIVYLRSLPPVHHVLPKTQIIFPVKYLMNDAPQPITAPVPEPDLSSPVKRGEYLVNLASCSDCHTPSKHGQSIAGLEFAGGFILKGPWGQVASANITPDASGISYYDEALFLQVMRTGYVHARKLSQIMPWHEIGNQTDEDLKAMFAYLRTIKPVSHRVDNTESATLCKKCGAAHGLGASN